MVVQHKAGDGVEGLQARRRRLRCLSRVSLLLLVLITLFPRLAIAQVPEPFRILILHGVWDADEWEYSFDNALVESLQQSDVSNFEISRVYLGLDSSYAPETVALRKRFVEAQIRDRGISLIITVLPAASHYLKSLQIPDSIPRLLMLPDAESVESSLSAANTAVVPSAAPVAMRKTIEQIRILKPDIRFIDVLAGTDVTDSTYLEIAKALSTEYQDDFTFRFRVGESADDFTEYVSGLDPSTSVILDLPLESYTLPSGEQASMSRESYQQIVRASEVPIFTFYENELGTGITGGFIASTSSYARSAARQVLSRVNSDSWVESELDDNGSTIYDWQLAQRYNLDLDRLGVDYDLVNKPASLWETNRATVLLALNVLALLALVVVFMAVLLQRSRRARRRIEKSERLARESEAKFKMLALNTIDVIWTWNPATNAIEYCSPSITKLTGFTPEEYMTKPSSELLTRESLEKCRRLVSDPDAKSIVTELQHRTREGGTVWCEMSAQSVESEESHPTWVGVTRDITQRKQYEAERDRLEASVRQNQKFESLGTLAGGIAHDFNNILAVMVGITDMLGRQFRGNDEAIRLLGKLESSTQRATGLVKQILTFSRQSDGDRTVVALPELIDESAQILKSGIPNSVSFETRLIEEDLHVLADRVQIEQVVLNIVTNAFQALDNNSGKICLQLSSCEIASPQKFTHGELDDGEYALIEVSDTGSGMTADQIDRIFDPFFTSKELGNGMGLAIVRGVVIKHGGALEVKSQPGQGTTFSIYLPLTEEVPTAELTQAPVSRATKRRRMLVVDDQAELLEILAMMTESLGHEVISCTDPGQALEVIANEGDKLDLVITDYSMPEITGLQIIDTCAKDYPELQVILCSGFGESLPESAEQLAGYEVPMLQKPFSIDALEKMLENMFAEPEMSTN